MDISSLARIERLNYVLGVVLFAAAALLMPWSHALGVLVGALLSCLNFTLMRGMVQRWVRTPPGRRGPRGLLLVPKMVGLLGAVFLAVTFLPVTAVGVLVGFSVFLASIGIETVRNAIRGPEDGAPEQSGDGAAREPGAGE